MTRDPINCAICTDAGQLKLAAMPATSVAVAPATATTAADNPKKGMCNLYFTILEMYITIDMALECRQLIQHRLRYRVC